MAWGISLFLIFVCGICALICAERDREKGSEKELKKLLDRLQDGHDPEIEHAILRTINGRGGRCVSKKLSAEIYRTSLDNLAACPQNASARAFVMDVGRWHLGRLRKAKRSAAADEQTIQHDILVRCRMVVPKRQMAWDE